jgi:aspartyl-tRNA(Asn)/glutamyl-tRNA(Gln) amidotransferase subunit A
MYLTDVLTIPSNLAGLRRSLVAVRAAGGLPIPFQLIGPQFSENALFRAAHALERAIRFDPVPERLR